MKPDEMNLAHKYVQLDEIEHCLARPGMYIGYINNKDEETFVVDLQTKRIVKELVTYNPAILKLFDEIISNSVDESKRNPKLDTIKVDISDDGTISVFDNGGIPVELHPINQIYVPEMLFSSLRAGSNFNDNEDRVTTGMHGLGATLVNIFSSKFEVETCLNNKKYKQTFTENNRNKTKPYISEVKSDYNYTKITFTPEYHRFDCSMDSGNIKKILKRIYDIAACNSNLKIYFNKERIMINSFKDYCKLYSEDIQYEENDKWKIGIGESKGFEFIAFVNSTETFQGGTHVDYVTNQIVAKIREHIKKKHKVDVAPGEIKSHLRIFINAEIVNPSYSSQTKENLITKVSNYGSFWQPSDRLIYNILKSPVIQSIMDWVKAKEEVEKQKELAKLAKDNSKASPRRIKKLSDANADNKNRQQCMLFISEGESASKAIVGARDSKIMGSYWLRGKPLNVRAHDIKKTIANEEFNDLCIAIGLTVGKKVKSIDELRYGKIVFMADADADGAAITGLLINMFHYFWPELFDMGAVYRFRTPIVRAFEKSGEVHNFYTLDERDEWIKNNSDKKVVQKYYKGLGSSDSTDFEYYLANLSNHLIPFEIKEIEDTESIVMAFSKEEGAADKRKEWLSLR
jgi:DNA topoisomerase-2